jgi:dTMP kinase
MTKRLKLRNSLNRYDKFSNNFYQKVQKGFLKLSKLNKSKYLIINSNLDKDINKSLIINKIDKLV